ncbi:DgyrCDS7035 [Dimorphilus gyrociliatus]|uniref:DgyrCDS7035 n=1 Tax=Dimorphilus gyrociliatus TaxID=2664684 RepID=A0A7I8VRI5_9ANNE|nr:DgyrCDS7035 [Dimorphilus gyrociliatus]
MYFKSITLLLLTICGSISFSLEYLDPFLEFNPFSPVSLPDSEEEVVTTEPKTVSQTCKRKIFPWDFIEKKIVDDKLYSRSCKRVKCNPKNITDFLNARTQVLNSSQSINTFSMNNRSGDVCVVVMFYANWCRFSAKAAPHYNALGRLFYNLDVVAIDGVHFNNLNQKFGTVSVPNIVILHNSKPIARFNGSTRNLESMIYFVRNVTGLTTNYTNWTLLPEDYLGPVPTVALEKTDYCLWGSWAFIVIICLKKITSFVKTRAFQGEVEVHRLEN